VSAKYFIMKNWKQDDEVNSTGRSIHTKLPCKFPTNPSHQIAAIYLGNGSKYEKALA
jgi:hypothetical protein